ncbi:inovirus-type Gp2 protein [Pseudomonas aeruginosa]|uniref:YagK/YfjJ domain-containing protein n=1 Tax=Pseudomonas aeruginosa TaxID=287 RepID=UPI0027DE2333|nr:inovirus-type Gp2 protein [Pseudomonas aeruginosa]WMI84087.1 inovirus-type Gp2 protein [Pseudomonas aeruginosa]
MQSLTTNGTVKRTKLTRYVENIGQMLELVSHSDDYHYGPYLRLFQQACYDVGVEHSLLAGIISFDEATSQYRDYSDTLNRLVDRIRQLTRERIYRRRRDDARYQERQQSREVAEYVDQVLDRYATTLVIRVDLYYRSAAQARLRVEHVFADLHRLIRSRERNPIFEHETGYICRVEQGERRGYHIHAAFFFNGAMVRGDIYKAQQIGALWEQITRGKGSYHNCNQDKAQYGDECGIGMIHRRDEPARDNVLQAMSYLVKRFQRLSLRPKGAKSLRSVRRGRKASSICSGGCVCCGTST